MNKFKYGNGTKHTFTILTSLSENPKNLIVKLNYQNYIQLSYKDYTKLCISCDKGPELCEGSMLTAINLNTEEKVGFFIIKIFKSADIWLMEVKRCDI